MLPGLGDDQRDRLEHAAKTRPLEVDALFRKFPKIVNPDLFNSIRVEARMRQASSAMNRNDYR